MPNARLLKAIGRPRIHNWGVGKTCLSISHLPTASLIHFLVKLSFAAPANFFSAADLLQAAFASVSHFFMKLVIAAPASFLLPASILHESALALPQVIKKAVTKTSAFIVVLP